MQGLAVQWQVRGWNDLRVVLEDRRVDVTPWPLLGRDLHHSVKRTDYACAFEMLLDIANVGIRAKGDVIDPVRYVHVPRLLVQGAEQVRVAECGEVHVPH